MWRQKVYSARPRTEVFVGVTSYRTRKQVIHEAMRLPRSSVVCLTLLAVGAVDLAQAASSTRPAAVVCPENASFAEALAAKEIRRYFYLRTAARLPIASELSRDHHGQLVVGCKHRPMIGELLKDPDLRASVERLGPQQYRLKTIEHGGRQVVLIVGGDPIGTLYGAYRLAEHLGIRFYLHGDVVPDKQIALTMPQVDEVGKPLFDCRGIQVFHDFPEGPDWWNADTYKAILGQLPKMRMNYVGLHTYSESNLGPEPLTWIGVAEDVGDDGTVKFSYPSRHFTTGNVKGTWGYRPTKTSDYTFGAAAMFDRDGRKKGTQLFLRVSVCGRASWAEGSGRRVSPNAPRMLRRLTADRFAHDRATSPYCCRNPRKVKSSFCCAT